jgi:CheY-like chemotaxis protein
MATNNPLEADHTVLIVDDNEDLRELMRGALQSRGYAVVTATEGEEALRILEEINPPCVILLDLIMPGMDGWNFCDKIRQLPELASVPVIVHSSASSRPPDGATRALKKPLGFDRLLSVVAEFCNPTSATTSADRR